MNNSAAAHPLPKLNTSPANMVHHINISPFLTPKKIKSNTNPNSRTLNDKNPPASGYLISKTNQPQAQNPNNNMPPNPFVLAIQSQLCRTTHRSSNLPRSFTPASAPPHVIPKAAERSRGILLPSLSSHSLLNPYFPRMRESIFHLRAHVLHPPYGRFSSRPPKPHPYPCPIQSNL